MKYEIRKNLVKATTAILLLAVMMISASAADIQLGKTSDKETYMVGDTVIYTLEVCNPSTQYSATLDIYDEFPDGNAVLQFNGVLIAGGVTIAPEDCWTDTVTYVVDLADVVDGKIWNYLYVSGQNSQGEPISASVSDTANVEHDGDCCIDVCESCGTKVAQEDHDAVYVLRPATEARIAYHDANDNGVFDLGDTLYVDMVEDEENFVVGSGDVRLTAHHEIPPNTKVISTDPDHGYTLKILPDGQDVVKYVDLNANDFYDLGDPLYVDTDGDDTVTVADVRLTARSVAGYDYSPFSKVQSGDLDVTNSLEDMGHSTGELLGYIDSDCSGGWTCPDKLYLQQLKGGVADTVVTIGDFRLYIPPELECWPPCGTKVEQGDIDATYVLDKVDNAAILIYKAAGAIYVDMDYDDEDEIHTVTQGDVRLTWYHDLYPPNTKVFSTENDKNNPLVPMDCGNDCIKYVDINNNNVYDLSDPLYLDVDDTKDVTVGDLRLTERVAQGVTYDAYTTVALDDWDQILNDDLIDASPMDDDMDLFGYIDSDCNAKWSCPDKLYLQQWVDEESSPFANDFVTVGDFRLYIPQEAIDEEGWPSCGTKVEQPDIDNTYTLRKDNIRICFDDANSDGVFNPEDGEAVYVDMFVNGDWVEAGDVRLSWYHDLYPPNTKVTSTDIDKMVELNCFTDQTVVRYVDLNNNGVYDISDPVYVDTDDSTTVSPKDVRLTERTAMGETYAPYTVVWTGDNDLIGDKSLNDIGPFSVITRFMDADCSEDWTCPDKLYLQQVWGSDGRNAEVADSVVTIGDFRLYWPPCESTCTNGNSGGNSGNSCSMPDACCDFDANDNGAIELSEAVAAVTAYFDAQISLGDAIAVINCYFG